jgi:prepilin-type N-terminal cleavage/methylation domain-containing protein
MSPTHEQRGFSALELTIVILVIGVLAAIAIPNAVTAYNGYQLQIAANVLEQQFNRCRQEAVRANQPTVIKVSANSTQIDVNRNTTFGDTPDGPAIAFSSSAYVSTFNPTNGEVTFTSRGEMVIGVNPSFKVVYGSRARIVSIDPRGSVTIGTEIAA